MLYALIGIILGIVFGLVLPINIAPEYSSFTGAVILVMFDSLIGAIRAQIEGRYSTIDFITGMFFYAITSLFFVYLGDKLNIDLYLAIVIVLMFRIVRNIGALRQYYLVRFVARDDERMRK